MKKIYPVILLLLLFTSVHSQKILLDKTDPFTGVRTATTDISKLVLVGKIPILQVMGQANISKDSTAYRLSFVVETIPNRIVTPDTTAPGCMLKLSDGTVLFGTWKGSSDATINYKSYSDFNYQFSKVDFEKISSSLITAVKFTSENNTYTFEVAEKQQAIIPSFCKKLLSL